MTPEERALLSGLFDRLGANADATRDPEADRFIAEQISRQPHAAYFLAQSVLVQEAALKQAEAKIASLEQQQGANAPSFLGNNPARGPWGERPGQQQSGSGVRFGSGSAQPAGGPDYNRPAPSYAPAPGGGGSSFLRGAAQTAVGVAGGVLAAEALSSLFGHSGWGGYGSAGYAPGETIIENQTINDTNIDEGTGTDGGQPADNANADDAALDQGTDQYGDDPTFDDGSFDDGNFDDGGFDDGGYDV